MSKKSCKSTKCECTLNTAPDEFNEKKLLLSFCMQRINISWKHVTCAFVAIYIVWSAYEISLLKLEMKKILQDKCRRTESDGEIRLHVQSERRSELSPPIETETDIESSYIRISERFKRSMNSTNRGRRKNKRKHGKRRHRRKRCHCKRGKDGAVGPKGPRGIPGAAGTAFALHAAHYVVDIPKPALRSFHQDNCETKWNGVLCSSNATFMNNGKGDVVQAFNTNNLNGTVTSPFSLADDGKFKILQDGLMLFYLNIAVLSKGPFRDSFAVHVDNKRIMQCTESKDITVPSAISPLFNAKEKTCSATGLHYVRKDQNVSIKILSADTAIILYPEMTYFGAVLLR